MLYMSKNNIMSNLPEKNLYYLSVLFILMLIMYQYVCDKNIEKFEVMIEDKINKDTKRLNLKTFLHLLKYSKLMIWIHKILIY
jgi:hypothetical protein